MAQQFFCTAKSKTPSHLFSVTQIDPAVSESRGHQDLHLLSCKPFALTMLDYAEGRYLILGWKQARSMRLMRVHTDYSFRASETVMVAGRGEVMKGKDCLLSWKMLFVKTTSVNLLKLC